MDAYLSIRVTTSAIRLSAPADTTLEPGREAVPVAIAVGAPGEVTIRLRLTQPRVRDSIIARVEVGGVASYAMSLGIPGEARLVAGTYGLEGEITSQSGETARHLLELDVEALSADTLLHEAPLADSLVRPESRTGPPSLLSVARGIGLGTAAVAVPTIIADADLGGRRVPLGAAVIGVSVALADIWLGRPDVPIPANVDYNRSLRREWLTRREATAAENERRRLAAPLRIRTRGGS
jgi:hypothetical protein